VYRDGGAIVTVCKVAGSFDMRSTACPAAQATPSLMDKQAKKMVGQSSRFG